MITFSIGCNVDTLHDLRGIVLVDHSLAPCLILSVNGGAARRGAIAPAQREEEKDGAKEDKEIGVEVSKGRPQETTVAPRTALRGTAVAPRTALRES